MDLRKRCICFRYQRFGSRRGFLASEQGMCCSAACGGMNHFYSNGVTGTQPAMGMSTAFWDGIGEKPV